MITKKATTQTLCVCQGRRTINKRAYTKTHAQSNAYKGKAPAVYSNVFVILNVVVVGTTRGAIVAMPKNIII